MKFTTNSFLRAMARHLGFQVKFVGYLPDNEHGRLIVLERRILINAHKPRFEHIFTVLHEIGHIMMHVRNQNRVCQHPWLHRFWNIEWIDSFVAKVRRHVRRLFNKDEAREWEADLWAMCAFFYIVGIFGNKNDLLTFLDHHPEKTKLFFLVGAIVTYTNLKIRIKKISQRLLTPFKFTSRILSGLRTAFPLAEVVGRIS